MERTISEEEKIRKAIEISERRNLNRRYQRATNAKENQSHKEYKLFKRMILQLLICLLLYGVVYSIHNTNDFFSKEVLEKTNAILNYDIDFQDWYSQGERIIKGWVFVHNKEENSITNTVEEGLTPAHENESVSSKGEEQDVSLSSQQNNSIDQMKQDAKEAKKICQFQAPLKGRITSEFRRKRGDFSCDDCKA